MPVFAYKGFDAKGKNTSGIRDADNPRALRALLKREGVFLTDAKEATSSLKRQATGQAASNVVGDVLLSMINPMAAIRRWKEREGADNQQVAVLTRQLATLLRAGVPLAESLGALVDQTEKAGLKRIIADTKTQVNEGVALADAMARHPAVFPDLYTNMVRAGEASGALEAVLLRLADFLDAQNRLRSKVISALFYPAAMVVIGTLIMGILMVTVVPKVTAIFTDTGKSLPWNTELLIAVSGFVADWWWALILLGIFLSNLFRRWKATPAGKERWDRFVLKVPVLGDLARMIAITRFAKTLSTLLASGVPLLRALDIVKAILGNAVLTKVIEEAKESIKEGESIASPLRRSGQFPPIVTHMISVGERSGQLEQMLENVAHSYDLEVDSKIGRLTSLLEPVMILVMGGSVAFIVFSILMPIMEMNEFAT